MQNLVSDPKPNPNFTVPNTKLAGANFLQAGGNNVPVQHGDIAEMYQEINRAEELKRAQQQAASEPTPGAFGAFPGKEEITPPRLA